jgi:glutathione S-transferase
VRELSIFVDLHLELVVREVYAQAFFGGTVGEDTKASVRKRLGRSIPAFKRLAKFAPYIAGDTFTQADCAAWPHLPLVGMATRLVFGEDVLLAQGVDWKTYAAFIGQRPHAARVAADRKAAQERLSKA